MRVKPTSYMFKMTSKIAELSHNNYKIYTIQSLKDVVSKDWFEAKFWQQNNAIIGQSSGRNTAYFIKHNGQEMVLRRYYRGGLMAKLSKDSYLFTGYNTARASTELRMLEKMYTLGLPVPRPVAAIVEKTSLFYCKNAILIERINESSDAYQQLLQREWPAENWFKMGQMIRQFHDHDVFHSDMNIHNILLDNNGKYWLIDFDKCEFKPDSSTWKAATLERLKRSLNKEKSRHEEFHFNNNHWQDVLRGYNNES